jgi:hypothetical protein
LKLNDFNFADNNQLQELKDEIRDIINLGKYQMPVVVTPPGWSGQVGESVLLMPSTGGTTMYYWHGTAWVSGWANAV